MFNRGGIARSIEARLEPSRNGNISSGQQAKPVEKRQQINQLGTIVESNEKQKEARSTVGLRFLVLVHGYGGAESEKQLLSHDVRGRVSGEFYVEETSIGTGKCFVDRLKS